VSKLSKSKERTVLQRAARYIGMATQLPFTIAAGYGLGYLLDNWLGTTWLKIAVLLLAIVGAFTQLIWQVLKDQGSKE
jgi:F0F1-type ATP synthase assembly protein I